MATTRLHSRRRSLLPLLLLALGTSGVAPMQGPLAAEPPRAERSAGGTSRALEDALDVIDADGIRADLRFIASDELAGRDTPSEGLRIAARYIRSRLQRLGFTPSGDGGSFFDEYRLVRCGLDDERTGLEWRGARGEAELAFGEDYYFWPSGVRDLDLAAELVFVGAGRADQLGECELEGRFALAWDAEDVDGLVEEVERRGAVGLLRATAPGEEDEHGESRASGVARWCRRPSLRIESEGFPSLSLARSGVDALLGGHEPRPGEVLGRLRDRRATSGTAPVLVENVAGLWPGSDPERAREVIVVSAHYDHVGVDGEDVYNGADDNGTGTCGMMAVAEALAAHGPLERSVLLLWVSGEEKGLLGSKAWTLEPTLPEGMAAVCNLNIDMIGRNAPDYLLITPTRDHGSYNGLTRIAERLAPLEGFPRLGSCDEYWHRSDHMNFSVQLGIPVAFLFSDVHEDYHKPGDTWDKVDVDKVRRVSRLVVRMLAELARAELSEL